MTPINNRQQMIPVQGNDMLFATAYEPAGADPDTLLTLVFSHGAGGTHLNWVHQVAAFAGEYRVVLWDHRGFGRSSNRSGLASPHTASDDLEAVLNAFNIDRAWIIAQSMGGWGALGLATTRPERVHGLVLADTCAGLQAPDTVSRLNQFINEFTAARSTPTFLNSPAVAASFAVRNLRGAVLYHMIGAAFPSNYPDVFTDIRDTTIADDALRNLTTPTLAITGEEDRVFPPGDVRAALQRLPNVEFTTIAGAGHSPYFEQPDRFNDVVQRYVSAHHTTADHT